MLDDWAKQMPTASRMHRWRDRKREAVADAPPTNVVRPRTRAMGDSIAVASTTTETSGHALSSMSVLPLVVSLNALHTRTPSAGVASRQQLSAIAHRTAPAGPADRGRDRVTRTGRRVQQDTATLRRSSEWPREAVGRS